MSAVFSAIIAYVMVFGGVALAARSAFPPAPESMANGQVLAVEMSPELLRVQPDALLE